MTLAKGVGGLGLTGIAVVLAACLFTAMLTTAGGIGASEARAQGAGVFSATATLQPRPATIGEHMRLTITVRHAVDLLVTISQPDRSLGIELVSQEPDLVSFAPGGDGAVTTHVFVLVAFELGDLHAGDVTVSWLRSDGSSEETTVRPPILRIVPVREEGDLELKPLEPQLSLADVRGPGLRTGAGIALAAALGLMLVGGWWRRRRQVAQPRITLQQAGHELEDQARARLDQLAGLRLVAADDYERYYAELSLTMREYLAQRFGFPATALTSREFEARAQAVGIERWQVRLVSGLLARCEDAVYARSHPAPTSANDDLTVAYEVIELARPDPLAVPVGRPAR